MRIMYATDPKTAFLENSTSRTTGGRFQMVKQDEPQVRHVLDDSNASLVGHDEVDFSELLSNAKHGDPDASDQLWQQCSKYLLTIANHDLATSALQKFGASDVVQQSMIIAHSKLPKFNGTSKAEFLAWMKQIVIYECRQTSRKFCDTAKRSVSREESASGNSAERSCGERFEDPQQTPATHVAQCEQVELVRQAMRQLKPLHQQVIQLRNWEDCSFEEIGQRIGKGADASRKLWARAVSKLEEELKKLDAI